MPKPKPLAIFCSDIHLSHKPPVARSAEPDWYLAMLRPLLEIQDLIDKYKVPVFYAGDIFDHWNAPAELINFALDHLPEGHCIAGQHDLPFHNANLIKKSALHTLIHANKLELLTHPAWYQSAYRTLMVSGFGWKEKIKTPKLLFKYEFRVAIVHKYLWMRTEKGELLGHPQAQEKDSVRNLSSGIDNYTHAFFGDNHIPFITNHNKTQIINCGSLMARHSNQRDFKPAVYVLFDDGFVETHVLDTKKDKWIEDGDHRAKQIKNSNLKNVIDKFKNLCSSEIDFVLNLKQVLQDPEINNHVRQIILEALEKIKK